MQKYWLHLKKYNIFQYLYKFIYIKNFLTEYRNQNIN
jgi:hypothetical protein